MAESTTTTHAFDPENGNTAAMPEYLRRLDEEEGYHPLGSVDIVWSNLYDGSDFRGLRFKSNLPITQLLVKLGKSIESGLFDHVFNVSASRFALFVTVSTTKGFDDLRDIVFLNL